MFVEKDCKKQLNWAILGCGTIAEQFAQAMKKQGRKLYGITNRNYEHSAKFAQKYGIKKIYQTFDELCSDPNTNIVYIATPHNTHISYILKALTAYKHVLCEKSITLNSQELLEAVALADQNHLVLAEAMTIFHMPLFKELEKQIATGKLGRLRTIQMNFGCLMEYDMNNRFFNRNLAGGTMLDIGVYALSFVRWFMSSCPNEIFSQVKYSPTGVDEQAGILLKNKEEEMATVLLSFRAVQPIRGIAAFDKGYIEVDEYPRGEKAVITYTEDKRKESFSSGNTMDALIYEIQDMETAISNDSDIMHLDYTIDVMHVMTEIRRQWSIIYPEEEH